MRRRKAPKRNRIGPIPEGCDLEETAKKVRYVGSPEHKDVPSFAGHPRPRADATICDRSFIDRLPEIQDWLEKAIRAGNVGDFWEKGFPRYAWHKEGAEVFIARHLGNGQYKGWLILENEWPENLA